MSEAISISPERQQARQRIRQYILENLMFSDDPSQLPDDVSLLDRGIIDSTGVLEVVIPKKPSRKSPIGSRTVSSMSTRRSTRNSRGS